MSTFKYWVRYQNGPSIANVAWNVSGSTYPNSVVSASGLTAIPQNTWVAVYDSGIDENTQAQSLLSIVGNLQSNPLITDDYNECNSFLILTASLQPTLSLNLSASGSLILSGSITGSYLDPVWSYVGSSLTSVTKSVVTYISSSFYERNSSKEFDSFLSSSTIYNFTLGSTDPTFQPQYIVWFQTAGPSPLWFNNSTTSSITLQASASLSGSYSVNGEQRSTTPQMLTVSQSLPNSKFEWEVYSEPSHSTVYIVSSSDAGNGTLQQVQVSASVAGNYVFKVTETSQYSFFPTASVVSSSGTLLDLQFYNFSQSGEYTYELSAYDLCGNYVSDSVKINIVQTPASPPTLSLFNVCENTQSWATQSANVPYVNSGNNISGIAQLVGTRNLSTNGSIITIAHTDGGGVDQMNIFQLPVTVVGDFTAYCEANISFDQTYANVRFGFALMDNNNENTFIVQTLSTRPSPSYSYNILCDLLTNGDGITDNFFGSTYSTLTQGNWIPVQISRTGTILTFSVNGMPETVLDLGSVPGFKIGIYSESAMFDSSYATSLRNISVTHP